MLTHLSIQDYAIVERLELELNAGMTVITGETGAGKSIMLDALGLVLGDRCDSGVIRVGAEKADISANFDLSDITEAKQWLIAHDLESDGMCLLRRVITKEGRSRGYINGIHCPLSHLKQLGELLVDIHSQHEHQSLLKLDTQRRLLDNFAGCGDLVKDVQEQSVQWKKIHQKLTQLKESSEEQQAKSQLLRYQLEELEALAVVENEVEELEAEQRLFSNAGAILLACQQVVSLCRDEDTNALSALNTSIKSLSSFDALQSELTEVINLLSSAKIQVEEAVRETESFVEQVDMDSARQQWVDERLDTIYQLARKHHVQPNELFRLQQTLQNELDELSVSDESVEALTQQLEATFQNYQKLAGELSKFRREAAVLLAQAIEDKMQCLGMSGGQFTIVLTEHQSNEPQQMGFEQVEFLVSANPGQPAKSLHKVASGGELSRISLAIQVITAQTSRVPTLIFDEVDVGVGGPTAEIVGQLLRKLGDKGQVLTVTHLAQVASQGHSHLFVHKEKTEDSTQTAVSVLKGASRVEEIARMLGGVEQTKESLAHAKKMLEEVR